MFEVSASTFASLFYLLRYKDTTQENKMYVAKQDGAIWRLVHEILADEEVVVSFQGILCKKDIAPYNEKNTCAQITHSNVFRC